MVIVAGHFTVEPQQRESYLAGCVRIVEQARRAVGCLDVAICADLVDPGRVNIFERCQASTGATVKHHLEPVSRISRPSGLLLRPALPLSAGSLAVDDCRRGSRPLWGPLYLSGI